MNFFKIKIEKDPNIFNTRCSSLRKELIVLTFDIKYAVINDSFADTDLFILQVIR